MNTPTVIGLAVIGIWVVGVLVLWVAGRRQEQAARKRRVRAVLAYYTAKEGRERAFEEHVSAALSVVNSGEVDPDFWAWERELGVAS